MLTLGTCCTTEGCSGGEATFMAVMLSTADGGCCTGTTAGGVTSAGATDGAPATTGAGEGST